MAEDNKNIYGSIDFETICSLFDKIDTAIWIIDSNRKILYVNNALVSLIGIPRSWLINQHMSHATYKHSIVDIVLREKKAVSAFQDINNFYNNEKYQQFIRVSPVFDDSGEIKYMIATIMKSSELYSNLENAVILASDDIEGTDTLDISENTGIVAASPAMRQNLLLTSRIANVDSAVLITGESGSGKQIIANEIHRQSSRKGQRMVEINCAALPEQLLEAELFGYEKGAFTGALKTGKKGLIEEADGGILFLDEINSMPLSIQGKLLRVLETKTIRRLGSLDEIKVDFRLISASNKDLHKMCAEGAFREDLYYRLNIVTIKVPSLRDRKEDIIPLANKFLDDYNKLYGRNLTLTKNAENQLLKYDWPGNVRELKNIIERIVVTADADAEELLYLPPAIFDLSTTVNSSGTGQVSVPGEAVKLLDDASDIDLDNFSLNEYLQNAEKQVLELMAVRYSTFTDIAKALQIDRTSVMRKFKKYGLTL